jgi:metallo-beta-lactamase class B
MIQKSRPDVLISTFKVFTCRFSRHKPLMKSLAPAIALFLALANTLCSALPADWTSPIEPLKISDNLYYVGSRDLAAYLVVTPQGNILINANLDSSPPQIRRSVERLGLRWTDIRILLNNQAHYHHVAGAAQIIQETGAKLMVMEGDAEVVESGGASDFDPTLPRFPASHVDRILHDNDTITLGGITLTAHKTAGHSRGCTTWTMQTQAAGRTLNVVIVGGWAMNPSVLMQLVASHGKPESYPGITTDFDHTFAVLKTLPCDIFLGAHGGYFHLLDKLARLASEGTSVWIDASGYREAVGKADRTYRKDLEQFRKSEPTN